MITMRAWRVLRRLPREYLDSGAPQNAAALAFNLFVAMLPLTLGVLTVAGLRARQPGHLLRMERALLALFPAEAQDPIRHSLQSATYHAGALTAFCVLGLIWFGTGLFGTTGVALNRIYGLPDRSFFEQRLRGLLLPLAFIGAASLGTAIDAAGERWLPGWVGVVAAWLIIAYLILFLYRAAPSQAMPWRDVAPGALLAGALIIGLSYGFPLYTQLSEQLSTVSRFFTVVFGLVAWVYCIALAILVGAVVNRARMRSSSWA